MLDRKKLKRRIMRRFGYKRMLERQPREVDVLCDAVSKKLGREACVRKVKNQNSYFIIDNAFSYFQKADRNRQVGYRAGYCFYRNPQKFTENLLQFIIVHSPIMFSFFHDNFDYDRFKDIIKETAKYRDIDHLTYVLYDKNRKDREFFQVDKENLDDFIKELDVIEEKYGFVKTLLSAKNSSKHNLGNTFYVDLAQGILIEDIPDIIDKTWDLFMWLYPSKPLFKRDASLYRSMQKIERKCEFRAIHGLPQEILDAECDGIVQAAHIKPHHKGGSDKLTNGLWLCERHHRMTEGKLTGSRDLEHVDVKYRP